MERYDKSIYSFLWDNQKGNAGKAMYFAGRFISYPKLFAGINRAAAAMSKFGIVKNDVITVALPNVPDAVYILYGAAKIGAVVNLVHPLLPFSQIKHYTEETHSKLVFLFDVIADGFSKRIKEINSQAVMCSASDSITPIERFFYDIATSSQRKHLNGGFIKYRSFLKDAVKTDEAKISGDDVGIIMHSSGTVDKPKSAALSHRAFNIESDAIISAISSDAVKGYSSMLAALPMFHAFGLGCGINCALSQGVTAVLVPKFSAELIVKYVNKGLVTYMSGVPTMYKAIVGCKAFDSPRVRKLVTAFCGGDVLDSKLKARFDAVMEKHGSVCRLYEGYGMTEAAGVFSANNAGANKSNSVGKPLISEFYAEAFNDGKKAERNCEGELCVSSEALMKFYLNDGELTENCFFEHGGKRWLKTGDYGKVDGEGYIFFTNRIKRVVKIAGVNVFPAQVEKILGQLPFVDCAAVVPTEHGRKGNELCAYVVLSKKEENAEEKIKSYAAENLDKWSCPKKIVFIDKMPLTNIGKTDYSKLGKS